MPDKSRGPRMQTGSPSIVDYQSHPTTSTITGEPWEPQTLDESTLNWLLESGSSVEDLQKFLADIPRAEPDELEITIDRSLFALDDSNGRLYLIWWGYDEFGQPVNLRFGCGQGWTTADGTAARRETDGFFHPNSVFGQLLYRIACGDLGGSILTLLNGSDPLLAQIWRGLRFKMKRVRLVFGKDTETVQPTGVSVLLPVEFLGPAEDSDSV